jgi:hypothetical protein
MIYFNGDSHSSGCNLSSIDKAWPVKLAKIMQMPYINHAQAGSCNDRILRSTTNFIIENKSINMMVLANSFLSREEIWEKDAEFHNRIHSEEKKLGSKLVTSEFLEQKYGFKKYRKFINLEKQVCDYYHDVYSLTEICKRRDIKYFIFSAASNLLGGGLWDNEVMDFVKNLNTYKELIKDPGFCDVDEFCLVGWATENDQKRNTVTDHLSEDGHNTFATYIHENYIKNLV